MFYRDTGHGHSYWWGYRHEAAITADFLYRTLKLPAFDAKQLDEQSIQAISEDHAIIADGYRVDDEIVPDEQKAFEYYQKAAALNHPKANFMMGDYYQEGELVEKDMDKAISYYQKSAELEYPFAFTRLGRMYMEADYFDQDWAKAHTHLVKAQQLDDIPLNNMRLARFYCTAPAEYKNVDKCLELMDLTQYYQHSKYTFKQSKVQIRNALGWIISTAKLTAQEQAKVKAFTIKSFALSDIEIALENLEEGAFVFEESERFGRSGKYKLVNPGYQVKTTAIEDDRYGIVFEIDGPSRRKTVGLVARWYKTLPNGKRDYALNILLYGNGSDIWYMLRRMDEVDTNETWTLEIYDIDQRQLYAKTFEVSP